MSATSFIQALRALSSKLGVGGRGPVESRFFSALWFYGAGTLLVAGVLAGQPALSLLATAVLAAAAIGWLWARSSLDQVELAISLSESRVFPDESVVLAVSLVNRSWRPVPWLDLTLQISDRHLLGPLAPSEGDQCGDAHVHQRMTRPGELRARALVHRDLHPACVNGMLLHQLRMSNAMTSPAYMLALSASVRLPGRDCDRRLRPAAAHHRASQGA